MYTYKEGQLVWSHLAKKLPYKTHC